MDFTYEPNRISLISDNNNLLAEVTFPDVDENELAYQQGKDTSNPGNDYLGRNKNPLKRGEA